MKRFWNSKIKFVLTVAIFLYTANKAKDFCYKCTEGFELQKIIGHPPYKPEWETSALSAEEDQQMRDLLNQKFTYLGKGAQCYAFLSEDQNYVLKFVRFDHLRPPLWLNLPFMHYVPFANKYLNKKLKWNVEKTANAFASYHLAFEELREETGLLYIHLNHSNDLQIRTSIIDPIGIAHPLDLDKTSFLLQKRADWVHESIENWMASGKVESAQEAIDNLLRFLVVQSKKGIENRDPRVSSNFGFFGTIPVEIDIGKFAYLNKAPDFEFLNHLLVHTTESLNGWLKGKYPELSVYLEDQIKHFDYELINPTGK